MVLMKNQFAVSSYVSNFKYMILFEQNSSVVLFTEAAWYENNSVKNYITDIPYSAGAGINFETKAGIFSLNYALDLLTLEIPLI